MRLFDAIIDANHRAVAGDESAVVHVHEFQEELPVVALTCIDPRLNPLFPSVLGLPMDQFIWLRCAGNIVSGPLSSTVRSLALACAVKGGREIAIIGHTDCQVARTSTVDLLEKLRKIGVDRKALPENLTEYFGMFASERQNVIKAAEFVRKSTLIGPRIPVHGLLVDVGSGRLEWLVNGYQALDASPQATVELGEPGAVLGGSHAVTAIGSSDSIPVDFKIGQPLQAIGHGAGPVGWTEGKIGDIATNANSMTMPIPGENRALPPVIPAADSKVAARPIPLPPPIRPRIVWQRRKK
jgi:carbonic anhydrase